MPDHSDNSWPPLGEDGFSDEYGRIEPEVYEVARELWPEAKAFAQATLRDAAAGWTLLMKAAANVSRARALRPNEISSLGGYLFKTYKNLILAELRKIRLHEDLTAQSRPPANLPDATVDEIDRKILVEQLMAEMDQWTRETFALLVLGYTFEEIGRGYKMLGASVRNRFNLSVKKLLRRLRGDDGPPGEGD